MEGHADTFVVDGAAAGSSGQQQEQQQWDDCTEGFGGAGTHGLMHGNEYTIYGGGTWYHTYFGGWLIP